MEYTLQEFQQFELEMLKQIDQCLQDAGIPYYLIGGSCIGALRHKGCIPWDDDADIGIHRKYFEQAEAALQGIPGPYMYDPVEHHVIADAPLGHLYLKDGTPFTDVPRIDVFALDNVPASLQDRRKQNFWARVYHVCILRRPAQNRGRLLKILTALICKCIPGTILDRLQNRAYREITRWKDVETPYISNIFGVRGDRECVPARFFGKPRYTAYEDTILPVPACAEEYMTHIYGDYMTYPPIEQRIPEHFDLRY